jgi:protoporphyrinogen oxidase
MDRRPCIIGAGMTGLAAALASGVPTYESSVLPGGICASYYVRPGENIRHRSAPTDGDAYRFEIGGGHWIWGADPLTMQFIGSLTPLSSYSRRAAVYLAEKDLLVPYPIQYHLGKLGPELAVKVLLEIIQGQCDTATAETLAGWAQRHFGPTLCDLFFDPFHDRYTAGLSQAVAPQDPAKSPVELPPVIKGAFNSGSTDAGYNPTFFYPRGGLDALARKFAERSSIHYGMQVVQIDAKDRVLMFSDHSVIAYSSLVSTLPLVRALELTNTTVDEEHDPFTSVLVLNIGARKGGRCPSEHWIYVPVSEAGFHRVGFYSNVDPSFLPSSARDGQEHVGIYVELARPGGSVLSDVQVDHLCRTVIKELQAWDWIGETEVVSSTWVETAYTWTRPRSHWVSKSLEALAKQDIHQVGRYARWASQVKEQSITHSIRDGLVAGALLKRLGK